jgi:broad specificity phosphatase PhoE
MKLLLLRHAATLWTVSGQHTGLTDLELTPAGESEARATAPLFQRVVGDRPLRAVYSSPRRRALRTAELVLGPAVKPGVTELIAEVDYGNYEGLTPAEIQHIVPGWNLWEYGCPGGETVERAAARADEFIEMLVDRHDDETVCAVSHGHMIRILAARLLNLHPREGRIFSIKTTSIAEFTTKNRRFELSKWNLTA